MDSSEKFLLSALDQSGIIALTDRHGRYLYVNKKWEEATGMPCERVIGRNAEEVTPDTGVMTALRTGRIISGELFQYAQGKKDNISVMKYRPLTDGSGNVTGCLITSLFDGIGEARKFSEKMTAALKEEKRTENTDRNSSGAKYDVGDIIGESPAMREIKEQIYIAGASSASCLIEGETGTGKELIAHAIHKVSSRRAFPFVRVNCSAIPENLMESEFFGYEEGSFTGGSRGGKAGKFENAHLGSMFLDEVNAMSLAVQPKLLRALQEKEIERVGGTASIPVDVRIISASNMPLDYLVEKGRFRRDLFYRLNIITIRIPPLRDRREDILPLAESFIRKYNMEMGRDVGELSGDALSCLMEYDWPGNVRELQNAIERAMACSRGDRLEEDDFRRFSTGRSIFGEGIYHGIDVTSSAPHHTEKKAVRSLSEQKAESEKEAIRHALEACGGNKSRAARMLNISRTLLYKKLEKYEIT